MRKSVYLTDPEITTESIKISESMGISFSSLVQMALKQLIESYNTTDDRKKASAKYHTEK